MTEALNPVRWAHLEDAVRIAEIQVEGWKTAYRGILPDAYLDRLQVADRVRLWERFIRAGLGWLFVAPREEVVGFCHLVPSRDADGEGTAEVAAIYIDPVHWRTWQGSVFMKASIRFAKEQQFKAVTLWVLAGNRAAREFYEQLGFQCDGAIKQECLDGFPVEEVRYRLRLPVSQS